MADSSVMERLATYVAEAVSRPLPAEVSLKTKHHILDTLAAMVSGSRLRPGQLAIGFLRTQGGRREAQVVGSRLVTTAINAAFCNGIMAHADETDDSHAPSLTHPGCAIVPAALAIAEREGASGEALLRAVALGYDIGTRLTMALGVRTQRVEGRSTHALGGLFGATAACASLARLAPYQVRVAFSYAAQQASGITTWLRDPEHVEKAFVFGGMPARNGVTAVVLAQAGFTGVPDVFSGNPNFFNIFTATPAPKCLVEALGDQYEITRTNIKKFPVGSPIQAAAEALTTLVTRYKLTPESVEKVEVHLPPDGAQTVNNRLMPDINCQYICAIILVDGRLTFQAAHSYERMQDPQVQRVQRRIELVGDPALAHLEAQRPARVVVHLVDGRSVEEYVPAVPGTKDKPMSTAEVEAKCFDLLEAVLGPPRARDLIQHIWNLDKIPSVRALRPFLQT